MPYIKCVLFFQKFCAVCFKFYGSYALWFKTNIITQNGINEMNAYNFNYLSYLLECNQK